MTDKAEVSYRLSLLKETIILSLTLLALRLHLITVTCDERYELIRRTKIIREHIANLGRSKE